MTDHAPAYFWPLQLGAMEIDSGRSTPEIEAFRAGTPGARLELIRLDERLTVQARRAIAEWAAVPNQFDAGRVRSILSAATLPPIVLLYTAPGRARVVDGMHRLAAWTLTGRTEILAWCTGHSRRRERA